MGKGQEENFDVAEIRIIRWMCGVTKKSGMIKIRGRNNKKVQARTITI